MATYNQLSYGSKGSDVTELQKLLNQNGYTLDVDGDFGTNTQVAVKDYQQKNGLDVDGIVGNNTWGALTKASTGATTTQPTATNNSGFQYSAYQESDAVKQAQEMLNQQLSQKPGAYQSAWQTQLNDTINKILNREKFSYDLNADALYQQYKDQYTTQGKMAMMDTMGQAASLTGGYGNSYAQSVGQQAYQGYLQQLNDKVPELYQLALNKYQMEGDDLVNQYSILGAQENQDYGRYRDQVSDYNTELDRLQNRYDTERDYDYTKWADNRDFGYGQYIDDRNYQYQQDRDKVSDEQWQKQFDEALRQWNFANKQGEYAPAASSGSSGSKGSSGGSGGGSGYDPEVAKRQEELNALGANLVVDGLNGSKTQAAEEKYGSGNYYNQLLGAVSTAKGEYSKQDSASKQATYKETVAAVNDAYKNGNITAEQKAELLKIATPGSR